MQMIIADIQDRPELVLVTDSQDVEQTYYYLGIPVKEGHSLFASVGDGEYIEVYEFEGTVPYLYKELTRLK